MFDHCSAKYLADEGGVIYVWMPLPAIYLYWV
jgi:hypothetical protein